jgi:hypothetical protein
MKNRDIQEKIKLTDETQIQEFKNIINEKNILIGELNEKIALLTIERDSSQEELLIVKSELEKIRKEILSNNAVFQCKNK